MFLLIVRFTSINQFQLFKQLYNCCKCTIWWIQPTPEQLSEDFKTSEKTSDDYDMTESFASKRFETIIYKNFALFLNLIVLYIPINQKLCFMPKMFRNNISNYRYTISQIFNVLFLFFLVNYPYPASFLEPLPAWPIKVYLKLINNS